MKKSIKILVIFSVFAILIGSITYAGNMVDFSAEPDICRFSDYNDSENTLPYVRFSAGRTEVDTNVNKSGICFSNNDINISSIMSKVQLFASSSEIKLTGSVEHSLLFSPKVIINGEVNGTSLVFGANVEIGEEAKVNGDLIVIAGSTTCSAEVKGNLIIVSDIVNVTEKANISGSLRITGSDVNIAENENITGFTYVKYGENLTISNALKELAVIIKDEKASSTNAVKTLPIFEIIISSLVLGAIYVLIKKKSTMIERLGNKLKGSTIKVIFAGLVGLFAMPIVAVISLIISILGLHVVGVPILIITIAMLIISAILKSFIVSLIISEYMLRTNYAKFFEASLNKFILFVVVNIIFTLASYIPVVGGYIDYLLLIVSFGLFITLTILSKTLSKDNK